MAIPRGSALASLSGIWGIPVLLLKRTETGVDGAWKCGALESVAASVVGVKVPVRRTPFACAEGKVSEAEEYLGGWAENGPGRKPGCLPKMACSWATRSSLVFTICSSDERGMTTVTAV